MIDDLTQEAAALYVFDLLEPAAAAAFAQRVEAEPELRALVDQLTAAAAALAHTAPAHPLPPALDARIFAAVRPAAKVLPFPAASRSKTPWLSLALAAGLALAALFLWNEQQAHQSQRLELLAAHREIDAELETELAKEQKASAAAQGEAETLRHALAQARSELAEAKSHDAMNELRIATLTSKLANAPDASAVIMWDEQKQRGVLRTKKLPAPPANHDYQLWVIDADHPKPVDAGIFSGSGDQVDFHPGAPVKAPKAFAVSLEAKGGVPEAKGPMVLVGE